MDRGAWTAKTVKRPRQQPAQRQYANYWVPLTRKRHTMPHPAQPRQTNHRAPRTRKRHQQEHRPQRPTESSNPTQHAKGRTGDCPVPVKKQQPDGMSHRGFRSQQPAFGGLGRGRSRVEIFFLFRIPHTILSILSIHTEGGGGRPGPVLVCAPPPPAPPPPSFVLAYTNPLCMPNSLRYCCSGNDDCPPPLVPLCPPPPPLSFER